MKDRRFEMIKNRKTIIIIFLISIPILFIYSLIYGVPFGGFIAKIKTHNYASVIYGGKIKISKPNYNFKNNSYEMDVVRQHGKPAAVQINYNLFENKLVDHKLLQQILVELRNDFNKIKEVFPDSIEVKTPDIFSAVIANGNYSLKKNELTLEQKIYASFINWDSNISPEESIKKPVELTRQLIKALGENYTITAVQVWYLDINGAYQINSHQDHPEDLYNRLETKVEKSTMIGTKDMELIEKIRLKSK